MAAHGARPNRALNPCSLCRWVAFCASAHAWRWIGTNTNTNPLFTGGPEAVSSRPQPVYMLHFDVYIQVPVCRSNQPSRPVSSLPSIEHCFRLRCRRAGYPQLHINVSPRGTEDEQGRLDRGEPTAAAETREAPRTVTSGPRGQWETAAVVTRPPGAWQRISCVGPPEVGQGKSGKGYGCVFCVPCEVSAVRGSVQEQGEWCSSSTVGVSAGILGLVAGAPTATGRHGPSTC